MDNSIDWDRVADLYDAYVQTDLDIPFFLKEARQTSGEVLELMSGTGRVSLPLLEAGIPLTCVDNSAEMLAVLRDKLKARGLAADVRQMDVRELALAKQFDLIFISFHSFGELLTREDQEKTLRGIYAHLSETGRFICTLHNPVMRLKSVDGQLRLWGKAPLADRKGMLLFWGLEQLRPDRRVVDILELFEEYDAHGTMCAKRLLEVAFCPLSKIEFQELVTAVGFKVVALYGDYGEHGGSEFREESSRFMIWVLEK